MGEEKIRNLELELVKKEENKITSSDNPSGQIRGIGTEEIRYYDSKLGRIETYTFFDNYGNSKEIIATNRTNIDEERRGFYKQRFVPMRAFSKEQEKRIFKEENKDLPARTLSKEKADKLLKIVDELDKDYY